MISNGDLTIDISDPNGIIIKDSDENELYRFCGEVECIDDTTEPTLVFTRTNGEISLKKEEKEMNKILQLYIERKEKEIHDKYDKLVEEEYNKIEFVEVYNNLVDAFEGALQELFEDETNVGCKYMTDTGLDRNTYKYRLASGRIRNEIREKYNEDEIRELKELHTLINEVETMLSLANNNGNIDNAKVQEILIKYNIIDKDLKIQA